MSNFAIHYRRLVLPQLKLLAKREAHYVVADAETFMGAFSNIEHQARALGALFLPEKLFADLEDWIATTLLLEIQALEQVMERVAERMRVLERVSAPA